MLARSSLPVAVADGMEVEPSSQALSSQLAGAGDRVVFINPNLPYPYPTLGDSICAAAGLLAAGRDRNCSGKYACRQWASKEAA